jgi:DNA-binding LacI/PurR family transcriptional regulator
VVKVTLQDVADRAGVSMKSVSNVVRGYEHVSESLRTRVQSAIDELGYRPDARGRRLATGRSRMLAFAMPDLRRPYFAELAHVFARVSADRGYGLLLEETGGTEVGERAVLLGEEAGLVDGMVIHPQAMSAKDLDALRRDTPVVYLGEDQQPFGADQVMIDNVVAARAAISHLVSMGRKRIGFLGHEVGALSQTSRLRLKGYRDELEQRGRVLDPDLLIARDGGDAVTAELALGAALDNGLDVDALLCRDDLAAIGALRALRLRGIEVPGQVAVVGWDAIEIGMNLAPSLTSVAADTTQLAERALDMLIERVDGLDAPGRHETVGHWLRFGESAPEPS